MNLEEPLHVFSGNPGLFLLRFVKAIYEEFFLQALWKESEEKFQEQQQSNVGTVWEHSEKKNVERPHDL